MYRFQQNTKLEERPNYGRKEDNVRESITNAQKTTHNVTKMTQSVY